MRLAARPEAAGEAGGVEAEGARADHNRLVLNAVAVAGLGGEGGGETDGEQAVALGAVSVDEAVCALCPFEYDVGAVAFVEGEEASVEGSAFLFEDSDDDLAAGVAEFFYARAIDF